jgi:outer membrane lipoprotein-sorting protein
MASDIQTSGSAARLTATQIVDKNVAARGGLSAWRSLKTLEMKGKLDAGGNNRPTIPVPGVKKGVQMPPPRPMEQVQLPFLMDMERGHKQRIEIEFNGQTAIQVYNGKQGWKLRPFLNRHQVENFTPEELKTQSAEADLDGFLIDYSAKGEKVESEGVEQVEGHDAYKLKVTDNAGHSRHVWVDAATFLEVKIEGEPRRLDGKYHPVAVYLRDYRAVNGLMMPYLLETAVEGVKDREKIQIESIVANPKLDDSRFAMPR